MLKPNQPLILGRGLPFPFNCNSPAIAGDNTAFINVLVPNLGVLPANPPFELHPYKQDFQLQDFDKYIIGTFPPISYLLDNPQITAAGIGFLQQPVGAGGHPITLSWIPFYHGNQGSMWDFLLTNAQMAALNAILQGINGRQNAKNFLINFLRENKINYADIIDSTQRNLNQQGRYDGKDKNLNNLCPNNDLICHILSNPKAKYLIFNSSSIFCNAGISVDAQGLINVNANTKSFDLFVRQCQELGLEIHLQIQQGNPHTFYLSTNISFLGVLQRQTKLAFELKIKNPLKNNKTICDNFPSGAEKVLTVVTGPSPSAINQLGLIGNIICDNWLLFNPGQNRFDFIRWVYQNFKNGLLTPLFNMNV
jgi:hypothetical protein